MAVKRGWFLQHLFEITFILVEMVIIFLFGFLYMYPGSVTIIPQLNTPTLTVATNPTFTFLYPYYQDIHVMMFVGFGFLLAYLKNHGWNAIGVNFVAAAVTIQVYILFRGFWLAVWSGNWSMVPLDFSFFLTAEYCVAAVLLTWAATVGRLGACQMVYLAIMQAFIFALNEVICLWSIKGYDIGGSMTVFTFGGFFALMVGLLNGAPAEKQQLNNAASHHATLFAFIGTLFLWVFWPSFNSARVGLYGLEYGFPWGNQSHRAVINTILAITASCISTFITSSLLTGARFHVEHILRGTLAGGVIIGSVADICQDPFAAIIIGFWGGLWATLFLSKVHPRLKRFDTIGVTSTFLVPGIWGGFISAIYVGWLYDEKLGLSVSSLLYEGRTPNGQAGSQLAILGISAAIGLLGGLIAGILVKPCTCYAPEQEALYDDRDNWVPAKEGASVGAYSGYAVPAQTTQGAYGGR